MNRRAFLRDSLTSFLVGPLTLGTADAPTLVSSRSKTSAPTRDLSCVVTAYCPCDRCCGVWSDGTLISPATGITSKGHPPIEGNTVAVDPTVFPYGTLLEIEGLGVRLASDCGGAIKGKRLDVFFDSHERALRFGKKVLKVRIFDAAMRKRV